MLSLMTIMLTVEPPERADRDISSSELNVNFAVHSSSQKNQSASGI